MKTTQELLEFYGVDIGKRYKVTKSGSGIFVKVGTIFTINQECRIFYLGEAGTYPLNSLDYLDYELAKPPILDNKEREYLQHYVMDNPAFKGKVEAIVKISRGEEFKEFLGIHLTFSRNAFLPEFKSNSMYKGMEIGRNYTPKELGLEE